MTRQQVLRIALAIYDHLQSTRVHTRTTELPEATWLKCQSMQRKIRRAIANDWQLAAQRLNHDFNVQLRSLQAQVRALVGEESTTRTKFGPSINDIYSDILSLELEFDEVAWCKRQGTLSVTTPEISLQNINLGRFEIELDWRQLPDSMYFRVIALDPNPADSNGQVTHPHVENESLCVGDASLPIQRALEQGRFADFFLIVNNVMQTYNSGSPYVSLDAWHGVQCADCGYLVESEDRYTCEKCEDYVCETCSRYCETCFNTFCSHCVVRCDLCDEDACYYCQQSCGSCTLTCCPNCLEEDICDKCRKKSKDEGVAAFTVARGIPLVSSQSVV